MKIIGSIILMIYSLSTFAAPTISAPKGPDNFGIITYNIKCDSGDFTIAQCLKDEKHCGMKKNLNLLEEASRGCAVVVKLKQKLK